MFEQYDSNSGDSGDSGDSGVIDGSTGLHVVAEEDSQGCFDSSPSSSLSTGISRTSLLEKFRNLWLIYEQKRTTGTFTMSNHSGDIWHSSYVGTKELCEKKALTTYRKAKVKLMNNFFKMQ